MKCKAETPPPYFIHPFVPPVRPSLALILHFITPLSNANLHTVLFYHKQLQTNRKKYTVLPLMSRKSRENPQNLQKRHRTRNNRICRTEIRQQRRIPPCCECQYFRRILSK